MHDKIRLLVVGVCVCGVAVALQGLALGATSRNATTWYWTPALCKSELGKEGMQLADGRTFYVANAYCVGWGGERYCEWSSGHRYRLYKRFTAYVRSPDSTVRTFTLWPTSGHGGYSASGVKVLGHEANAARFNALVQPIAAVLARAQQQRGCAPYTA